jgi:hypothetical protein
MPKRLLRSVASTPRPNMDKTRRKVIKLEVFVLDYCLS